MTTIITTNIPTRL